MSSAGNRMHTFRNSLTGTSLLEKLNHHFVRMGNEGYYFCMMTTIFSVGKCKLETWNKTCLVESVADYLERRLAALDLGHDRIKQMKKQLTGSRKARW